VLSRVKSAIPALIPLVVLTASVEVAVRAGWVHSYLVPAPSEVFSAMIDNRDELFSAVASTSASALAGFVLSTVAGIAIAVFLSSSRAIQRAFYPYAVFFQTVPIIAIAPLLVIWFGFGTTTVRASAFIVSLFPILANTLTGLEETDPLLRELFGLYKPPRWKTIAKLQIPSAIPYIMTGLRISVGLATIGAIVGEFIAGGGLGSLIDSARTQQRVDLVFGGVLASSLLALFLVLTIDLASRLLLGRRPYTRSA